jgi:hypothetical protein
MTTWLTEEWFDQTRPMEADRPACPGLNARIQVEVTGGPEGDVAYYRVLEDGRLADSGPGAVTHPEVTVTLTWDDARAVDRGELDPNVAFMRGRMKVAGSMAVVLALLPLTATPGYRELRRRIVAVTEF